MADAAPREQRAVILAAAREVLDAAGYRGFTVEEVAVRAGVDPAVIGRLWSGAGELLVDVLADAMAIAKIPNVGNSRGELGMAVQHLIGLHTDRQRFEPALLALAANHAGDPAMLEMLRQRCVQRSRARVDAVLRRAAARGDLPPDVDCDLVHDVWAGAIAYRRLVTGSSLTMSEVGPLVDLVLSGMAPIRAPEGAGADRPAEEPTPWWFPESAAWLRRQTFGHVQPVSAGVPVRALGAIRPTATIAGHPVTIAAHVSRDFEPQVEPEPNSTALGVFVTITAAGPGVLPPFLRADRIAVLHDDEVWVAPLTEFAPHTRTSRSFEVVAPAGPEWETGTSVDVVVQLETDRADDLRLVRVEGQRINRTD
jgi:AcrR family transcriptional regulator